MQPPSRIYRVHLFDGLEQILLVRRIGRDAPVAAELERGHENAHSVLLVFGEAVFVIVQHLIEVQRQLGPVLSDKTHSNMIKTYFVKNRHSLTRDGHDLIVLKLEEIQIYV